MNYRKIRKNAKALSPVVASIILIAVTVAVSVVVAAWMGGMTIGLMGNAEQASVTNAQCSSATLITVNIRNTGSNTVTLSSATIDGNTATLAPVTGTSLNIAKGETGNFTVTSSTSFNAGAQYEVKLLTAKGTTIVCTATYNGQ
jgi:archaeal type IV pilus assembly protein PilA